MKNLYFTSLFFLIAAVANAQSVYPGNTRSGYGGALGQGSLSISEDATNYYFTFTKGPGDLNDAVVIYMHTRSGGYNTTANFTDQDDGLRKAISGLQGSDRATLIFPSAFTADFAIAFDQGFGGVWELVENAKLNYINSVALTPTGTTTSPTYTFTLAKADVGNPSGFKFLATYVSETGYRSNEFIGDAGPATNPQNSSYTVTSTLSFANPLPVGYANLSARFSNHSVGISWSVAADCTEGRFVIERSSNGINFYNIGTVPCTKSSTYFFEDMAPVNGNNYYRIVNINPDGKKEYSKTISVHAAKENLLKAFISGNKLKIVFGGIQKGTYKIGLINASGQAVLVTHTDIEQTGNTAEVVLAKSLSAGVYSLLVKGNGIQMSTQVFVK